MQVVETNPKVVERVGEVEARLNIKLYSFDKITDGDQRWLGMRFMYLDGPNKGKVFEHNWSRPGTCTCPICEETHKVVGRFLWCNPGTPESDEALKLFEESGTSYIKVLVTSTYLRDVFKCNEGRADPVLAVGKARHAGVDAIREYLAGGDR